MLEKSTYYILDAQGNQLSIYEHSVDSATNTAYYYLTYRNIYGSSRLGVTKDTINMFNPYTLQSYGVIGNRNYELTDHRGNVQTVINDIKYPLSSDNTTIDSYEVGINSIADYSPFGVQLDGRTIDNVFYYPENGNSPQTPADTVEIYNNDFDNPPATGSPYYSTEVTLDANLSNTKWTSSTGTFTNYNSSGAGSGKSIAISSASADTAYLTLSFDVENGYELDITSYSFAHRSSTTGYTNYKLVVNGIEIGNGSIFVSSSGSSLQSTGNINVANAVSGLLGPVNVVLKLYGGSHGHSGTFRMDDFVLNGFVQEESNGFSPSDYFVSRNYRNSFQGQEHHDEIRGKGNYINYKYRGHDPRIGRLDWLVDPLAKDYPWNSPYAFSENNVIHAVELEGLEKFFAIDGSFIGVGNVDDKRKMLVLTSETASSIKAMTNEERVEFLQTKPFDIVLAPNSEMIKMIEKVQKKGYKKEFGFAYGIDGDGKLVFSDIVESTDNNMEIDLNVAIDELKAKEGVKVLGVLHSHPTDYEVTETTASGSPKSILPMGIPEPSGIDFENQGKRLDFGIVQQSGMVIGQEHKLVNDMLAPAPAYGSMPQKVKSTDKVSFYGKNKSENVQLDYKTLKNASKKIEKNKN